MQPSPEFGQSLEQSEPDSAFAVDILIIEYKKEDPCVFLLKEDEILNNKALKIKAIDVNLIIFFFIVLIFKFNINYCLIYHLTGRNT